MLALSQLELIEGVFGPAESEKRLALLIQDFRSTEVDNQTPSAVSSDQIEQELARKVREDDKAELDASTAALAEVMRWRLNKRYGIAEQAATTLVDKLATMRIKIASSADLQIPAMIVEESRL